MDLTMCIITVFSISLLCYVIGDLDQPFSGYFRVSIKMCCNLSTVVLWAGYGSLWFRSINYKNIFIPKYKAMTWIFSGRDLNIKEGKAVSMRNIWTN